MGQKMEIRLRTLANKEEGSMLNITLKNIGI
jgi:hypothetical protein